MVAFSDQGGVLASLNLQASCSVPVTGVDENVLEQAGAYENRIMSLHQGQPLPPLGALSTAVGGAFGSLFENCL